MNNPSNTDHPQAEPGTATATSAKTCVSCGKVSAGQYCSHCGEKLNATHSRSVKAILEEGFHYITHLDGKFVYTLRTVLFKPGQLSFDYCAGIRKKYFKPLSFFLTMVILYLLFPMLEGLNMRVQFHQSHPLYGMYALRKSEEVKIKHHYTEEKFTDLFHQKGEKTSKFLLFITIPFMALISMIVGYRRRPYYYDHFILATEAISFFILFGYLLIPLVMLIFKKSFNIYLPATELNLAIVVSSVLLVYLTIASKRFFSYKYWQAILYALVFAAFLALFIQFIYKVILFYVVIHLM